MPTVPFRWETYPIAPQSHFDQFPNNQRLIIQILYNRGIFETDSVAHFLDKRAANGIDTTSEMAGTPEAVDRIATAIQKQESIVVYGDYDADGVTSTALMVQALRAFGANVRGYIPNRFEEGYGLNQQAIADLAAEGVALIITVDCGIRSAAEVTYGNELGVNFIITDHHQIPRDELGQDIIPPAVAVLNPKRIQCQYPFKDLAGVGVAFKLIQALQRELQPSQFSEEDIIDLVAIGTVADMAPLVGENRFLVQSGLSRINKPKRIGLKTLIEHARLRPGEITAGSIGFTLGPRLNAAGRLTTAQLAYELLTTSDATQAKAISDQLNQINLDRQQMTQTFVDQAREKILQGDADAPIHLVIDETFNEGVVGLVASRLADEFYRPVLVAHHGEKTTKGSARSIPEFDITRALDQVADLLVKYGGHAAAAGFTINNENLPEFRLRLHEIAQDNLGQKTLQKTLPIDAEINLRGVNFNLVQEIQALQPFGYSNPTPKFMTKGLIVKHHTVVGKEGNHLKMKLFDGKQNWDAIGFQMGHTWSPETRLTKIDAAYSLEINTWQGRSNLQLNLKDIRPET
ncbi:MAG: single-stranded-DNA-specific exonuclease RecJ [Chloroflexota bacterium]